MRNDRDNVITEKVIEFSVDVIRFCEVLESKRQFVIARQLLRSATSIGANVFEAQNAETRADFIHKMKIAAKEASESLYWLVICERCRFLECGAALRNNLDAIIRILSKIISTAKAKLSSP